MNTCLGLEENLTILLDCNEEANIYNMECSICFEEIDEKNGVMTKCKHIFHKKCIDKWKWSNTTNGKAARCPLCRKILVRAPVIDQGIIIVDHIVFISPDTPNPQNTNTDEISAFILFILTLCLILFTFAVHLFHM